MANSDNLGAVLDPRILAWLRAEQIPFLMEVTERTEADRKGGHLARRRADGRLVLRETAQTPEEDLEALQDITPPPLRRTRTTSGSTCARSTPRCASATASSACR